MAVAAGLSFLGVLSLAGAVSPALDLLNHATPLFFLASLATLACRVWFERELRPVSRRSLLAVGLTGLLSSALVLWPSMIEQRPLKADGPTITVLSMNLWERNVAPAHTIAMIKHSGADVLLLQEIRGPAREVVEGLRADYPFSDDCLQTNRWCTLAVLSRKPIARSGYHQAPWKNGDNLSYAWAEIGDSPAGRFTVLDTKLVHPDLSGVQATQIDRLADAVEGFDPDRLIVAGDFNLTPWSFALRRADKAVGLPRLSRATASWPDRLPIARGPRAPFPFLPIDQFYAGKRLRPVRVVHSGRSGSDHYGLIAVLSLY